MRPPQTENAPRPRRVMLLTTLAALLLAALMVTMLEAYQVRDAHLKALATQAAIVAGNSSAALVFGDQRSARETLATLEAVPDIVHAALYDPDGQHFAEYRRPVPAGGSQDAPARLPPARLETREIEWGHLAVTQPVRANGRIVGMLRITATRASDWRHLAWYALVLLALTGASLGGAYALMTRPRRDARLAEEALAWRAHHDPVSGLPNRFLFLDRLEQALARARRAGAQLALIYFDLDYFKQINDTLGHEAGDAALRETARRAGARLRASDTLARMSGDEFAVLLEPLNDPAHARLVAEQLMQALNAPFELAGRQVFLGASMGIAIYATDGENAEALLRAADTAMYFAKGRGRNNIQFYTAALNETLERRLELQSRLRHALLHDELEVHYQPIVSLRDGRWVALEGLLRWRHPERGLLAAGEFLPEADEARMSHLVGEAVLRRLCAAGRDWRMAGRRPPPLAANVTAAHLLRPAAVTEITALLDRYGMRPEDIEIEISEQQLHAHMDELLRVLEDMKSRGYRLSMDDFGSGFVSLRSLWRLGMRRVKIDHSVISGIPGNPDSKEFVRTVLALGQSLGFEAVAEGVETEAQVEFLRAVGCPLAQGYYFGRPVPPSEIRFDFS